MESGQGNLVAKTEARIINLHGLVQHLDLQGFWGLAEVFRKMLEKEIADVKNQGNKKFQE
jgi:hypothetical protein